MAYNLENDVLVPASIENNRVKSNALGLELVNTDKTLRLFSPQTNEFLKNAEELALENEKVIGENERLKAEIERLKTLLNKNS